MQPQDPTRCRPSCDAPPVTCTQKGVDARRMRHVDPIYSVYRWECGSYPYFKVPPANSSCSGITASYPGGSGVGFPGRPSSHSQVYCDPRAGCFGDTHQYCSQPDHCVCDPRDPRYHPHPEMLRWESDAATGCPCCGQHPIVQPRGPYNHAHHLDPDARLYGASAHMRVSGPDDVRPYLGQQESIESTTQNDAPVHCLPDSPGTKSTDQSGRRPSKELEAGCSGSSPSTSAPARTEAPAASMLSDGSQSNVARDIVSPDDSMRVEGAGRGTSMTNFGSGISTESKEAALQAGNNTSPSLASSGKITDTKKFTKSLSVNSKVTPLYGRPSWWGDEPEQDGGFQWKYNPLSVATSLPSSSPASASCRLQHCQPDPADKRLKRTDAETCDRSHPPHTAHQKSLFDNSAIRQEAKDFAPSGPTVDETQRRNPANHSPPERDRPSTVTASVHRLPDPRHVISASGDDCISHGCRAPTAFIVDLEHDDVNGGGHRITVKTSLREFLPRRCERSLERRLSRMRTNRKRNSTSGGSEIPPEADDSRLNRGPAGRRSAPERLRFKSKDSESFRDSFEEAVGNDVIEDDVSEAGTYTIDVSSDGESKAVSDAREKILSAFGIGQADDPEPSVLEWCGANRWNVSDGSAIEQKSHETRPSTGDSTKSGRTGVLEEQNSDSDSKDPATPTAKTCWNDFKDHETNLNPISNKRECHHSLDQVKLVFTAPKLSKVSTKKSDIVLTVYAETSSECTKPRVGGTNGGDTGETFQKGERIATRSIRSIDTAVLLKENDWGPRSPETWKSEDSVDMAVLLQGNVTLSPGYDSHTKPTRSVDETRSFVVSSSGAQCEPVKSVLPAELGRFESQKSFCSSQSSSTEDNLMYTNQNLDFSVSDKRLSRLSTVSTAASESGDSLENYSCASPRDLSSRTDATLDVKVHPNDKLTQESKTKPAENFDHRNSIGSVSVTSSLKLDSDFDEDGSSVDPLDDLVATRTTANITTEVLSKPTEDVVQVTAISKASKNSRKVVEENTKTNASVSEKERTTNRPRKDSDHSNSRAVPTELKIASPHNKAISEVVSGQVEKQASSRHPKTKPPTPKAVPKNAYSQSNQLLSRRCFSDLDVAGHDDSASGSPSTVASDGKGTGYKGTGNSVEHTRMNRTFALRCAKREAGDSADTPKSEGSSSNQRYARTSKKSGSSKFDDVQRSRSASRSRPGMNSPRSLFDSSRSTDTGVSVGQRIMRRSVENDKRPRQPSTETGSSSRSFSREEATSQKSSSSFRAPVASKKKKNTSDHGADESDGASGLSSKGSPVQPRPVSGPTALQESPSSEWARRKKYNPKQSLQTEAAAGKKTGKPDSKSADAKSVQLSGAGEKADSRNRNRKKVTDTNSLRSVPSTSSDWTDDEKLQLSPCGRDLTTVCQLSAKVKVLSDQVLQALRKRPEFKVNETLFQSPRRKGSDGDSLDGSTPEFLYVFHNLQAAERQMSAVFRVLSSQNQM